MHVDNDHHFHVNDLKTTHLDHQRVQDILLFYVTREKGQDNEGYDYLANGISEQHIYSDLVKVAEADRKSPSTDYQESEATAAKALKSPNRGLMWKILLLIFGGSSVVLNFYFIINAIINGGAGCPLTTAGKSASSHGQSTTDIIPTFKTTITTSTTTTIPKTLRKTCDGGYTFRPYLWCPEPPTVPPAENYLAWFPETNEHPPKFTACFVKVKVINGEGEAILATSEMGTYENPPNGLTYYGHRMKCLSSEEGSVCLEFKAGGKITDCLFYEEDSTLVTVKHESFESDKTCTIEEIRDNLLSVYGEDIVDSGPDEFQMYLHGDKYGERFGIYCEISDNEETALMVAQTKCSNGDDSIESVIVSQTINNENWAVTMTCA